jgi:hypothetical protein
VNETAKSTFSDYKALFGSAYSDLNTRLFLETRVVRREIMGDGHIYLFKTKNRKENVKITREILYFFGLSGATKREIKIKWDNVTTEERRKRGRKIKKERGKEENVHVLDQLDIREVVHIE